MGRMLGAVAAVLGALAAPAAAQTVDEIVARNAEARGGAAAWRALRSMRLSGRMELGHGVAVPFRLELKRPLKMRLEFDFDGQTAVQTYDGAAGWKLAPYLGRTEAERLSGTELAAAAGQAELDGPLIDYRAKGHHLELVGRETVGGRDTVHVRLTLKSGAVREVYLDAETFLEARVAARQRLRTEEKELGTLFRDYRSVGGLLVPHVLESRLEGAPFSHTLTVHSVELDVELPDARFGRPTPAAAMGAAPPGGSGRAAAGAVASGSTGDSR